jgi:hypothetical protein
MNLMIRIRFPARDFDFTTSSRPALGPTQPPAEWESRTLSTGVMRPGQEDDTQSSADVKNTWSSISIPLHCVLRN